MRWPREKSLGGLLGALIVTAIVIGATSCISTEVPEGARPSVRYLAAIGDYNQAKSIAVSYAAQPDTPVEHVDALLKVVEDGDSYIKTFENLRKGLCTDPKLGEIMPEATPAQRQGVCVAMEVDYASAAGALRTTSSILRQLAKEEPE